MRARWIAAGLTAFALVTLASSGWGQVVERRRPADVTHPGRPIGNNANQIECLSSADGSIHLSADSIPAGAGAPVTVTWTRTPNQGGCADLEYQLLQQADLQPQPVQLMKVSAGGSYVANPLTSTTFTLRATERGEQRILGHIRVEAILSDSIYIRANGQNWLYLLVTAIQRPNTTVRLAQDIDMNVQPFEGIYIAPGVTLTGDLTAQELADRAAAPLRSRARVAPATVLNSVVLPGRGGLRPGPRLYSVRHTGDGVFQVRCDANNDHVRFSGFRLLGRFHDPDADEKDIGIKINSCTDVDVGNMDISGFSSSAVRIEDGDRRQFNPNAVRVHDSYIHDNRHHDGFGYGVDVGEDAYADIEHNVFDGNRHAITASGFLNTGYRATGNLVLAGGGRNAPVFTFPTSGSDALNDLKDIGLHAVDVVFGGGVDTQEFDIHGDHNCPSNIDGLWNCGDAGQQYWIDYNAFQYTSENALKVRGRPTLMATISHNIFSQDDLDDAITLQTHQNVDISVDNQAGYASLGLYGACDFDGDGRDDLFLPTGRSFWYSSGGQAPWRFLKLANERLAAVGLGDFDGDGRCDVAAKGGNQLMISSAGAGEWTPLPGAFAMPMSALRFFDRDGDGKTDIFYRADDGLWSIRSAANANWEPLQRSSLAIDDLRFGDLDGDGVRDVIGIFDDTLRYSPDGKGEWVTLRDRPSRAGAFFVGDFVRNEGRPRDDIAYFEMTVATGGCRIRALVSTGGRGAFSAANGASFTAPISRLVQCGSLGNHMKAAYAGAFDENGGDDLLWMDPSRRGHLYSSAHGATVSPYSHFLY